MRLEEQILAIAQESANGITSKDLAILLRTPTEVVRRRLALMKRDGLIAGTGEYRANAAVVVVTSQRVLALA